MLVEFDVVEQRYRAVLEVLDGPQAELDAWVVEYNTERPHQSCRGRPPAARFALAQRGIWPVEEPVPVPAPPQPTGPRPPGREPMGHRPRPDLAAPAASYRGAEGVFIVIAP